MTIRSDSENNEIRTLFDLVDFSGKHVLEIGCDDCRLTRRYAEAAAHVTGIDPFEEVIGRANANQPDTLPDQVEFHLPVPEGYFLEVHHDERVRIARLCPVK